MKHSKPVRLETASTGGESVHLFLESTINPTVIVTIIAS